MTDSTLIKEKIKFSSYIRKLRGIGCKIVFKVFLLMYFIDKIVVFLVFLSL